jgi:hypothetical protein
VDDQVDQDEKTSEAILLYKPILGVKQAKGQGKSC